MTKKAHLIDSLATDLQPVHRLRVGATVALWLIVAWAFVWVMTLATGDLRPGFVDQLRQSPRYVVECALGFVAGAMLFHVAILLSVPGAISRPRAALLAIGILVVWFGAFAVGLAYPALEPSMLGKRPHCFVETFAFSTVPMLLGVWLIARRLPLARGATGALVGGAAASIPAAIMQIACMYDPTHILQYHLSVVLIVGAAGAFIGWLAFRKP